MYQGTIWLPHLVPNVFSTRGARGLCNICTAQELYNNVTSLVSFHLPKAKVKVSLFLNNRHETILPSLQLGLSPLNPTRQSVFPPHCLTKVLQSTKQGTAKPLSPFPERSAENPLPHRLPSFSLKTRTLPLTHFCFLLLFHFTFFNVRKTEIKSPEH